MSTLEYEFVIKIFKHIRGADPGVSREGGGGFSKKF